MSDDELKRVELVESDKKRRTFLKSGLVGIASIVGFSGVVQGKLGSREISNSEREEILERYKGEEAIKSELVKYQDFTQGLKKKGIVDRGNVREFIAPGVKEVTTQHDVERINGEFSPVIKLGRSTEEGFLTVVIHPEQEEIYAMLNDGTGPEMLSEISTVAGGCNDDCCELVCVEMGDDCGTPGQICSCKETGCGNCDCRLKCLEHCI